MSAPAPRPLAGIRIADLTHVLAGPFATYLLTLLGAEVVRIERPDRADMIRTNSADPALARREMGEGFAIQSAGKRSLAIDLKTAAGRDVLARLIERSDVLVENFRPGKLARLGFEAAALLARHKRLILCSISGYSQNGPDAAKPAYDHAVQAAAGFMAANALDGRPRRIGFPVIDYAAGLQAGFAILAALLARERAGGELPAAQRHLDCSMFGAAATLLSPALASIAIAGRARPVTAATAYSGSPFSGTFACADGTALALVANTQAQVDALLRRLAELGAAPDLPMGLGPHSAAADPALVGRVQAALGAVFAARDAATWEALLTAADVPAARVRSLADMVETLRRNGDFFVPATLADTGQPVDVPGLGFGWGAAAPAGSVPRRGEDSRAVLAELGYPGDAIEALIQAGTVRVPPGAA